MSPPPDGAAPSRDQLLAMAYADGELEEGARREFEHRMATEPALAREVAELQRLAVLARLTAPAEPKDFEWQRIQGELLHSTGWSLGWILTTIGTLGLGIWGVVAMLRSEMDTGFKFLGLVVLGGLGLLFLLTLRARLRTLTYDPYREVRR